MRGKLILAFWKKEGLFCVFAMLLFVVAGLCTDYHCLSFMENYHRWEPVRELGEGWYFYIDRAKNQDCIENYLLRRGAVNVLEFRREHCSLEDPTDIGYDDHYADGVLWQATPEDVQIVQVLFPEASEFYPTMQVVAQKDVRRDLKWWILSMIQILAMWGIAILVGVLWFRNALDQSGEEMAYLAYLGNDRRVLRKLYCKSVFVLVPIVWLCSFVAILFPGPGQYSEFGYWGYRQIYVPVPIVVLLIVYTMTRIFYVCCWRILKKDKRIDGYYVDRGVQRIYISDFTVAENLQLVLMSQGFSQELSITLARLGMKEQGIDFCANRVMEMCPSDEKLIVYDLQEEFMAKKPIEIQKSY